MKTLLVLLLLAVGSTASVTLADDGGLDARTSMKVNRAKRHQALDKSNAARSSGATNRQTNSEDPCKGVDIGNVYTDGNRGATPRENIVVVTGDVINIPNNRCR